MTTTNKFKPTRKIVLRILDVLSHGLVRGLGNRKPGQMCVEAVICFAYDLPHGDEPPCVGKGVQAFNVRLNECYWPSNTARAEGMKLLAIAQLGSDALDQMDFSKRMFLRGTQLLLPFVFRKEAAKLPDTEKAEMLEWAHNLAAVTTLEEARQIAKSAATFVGAPTFALASTASAASAFASGYAATASAASGYVSIASTFGSGYALGSGYSFAPSAYRHELLRLTAQVGLDVLKEMKSPGCRWLYLAKAPSDPKEPKSSTTTGVSTK